MYAFDESLDMAQDTTDFDPLLQDNSLIEEADDEATNTVIDPTGPTKNTYIMVSFKGLKVLKINPAFTRLFTRHSILPFMCQRESDTLHFFMNNSTEVRN